MRKTHNQGGASAPLSSASTIFSVTDRAAMARLLIAASAADQATIVCNWDHATGLRRVSINLQIDPRTAELVILDGAQAVDVVAPYNSGNWRTDLVPQAREITLRALSDSPAWTDDDITDLRLYAAQRP